MKQLRAELVAHCGGKPSVTQWLLIDQAVKLIVQRDLLSAKLASGVWTGHDGRTFSALLNSLRLTLRELGLKSRGKTTQPTLAEMLAAQPDLEAS